MNSNLLSKYRTELFGISTIGILIVHSNDVIQSGEGALSEFIRKLFAFGGVAVYAFVFLSGIGLYFSMSKMTSPDRNEIRQFYKRRLSRLLMPYLFIAGSSYTVELLLLNFKPIEFLFRLSTLQFWFQKKGVWFISMLIPLYVVYPIYYRWVESGHRFAKTAGTVLFIVMVSGTLFVFSPDVYDRLMQVWNSYIVFVIGHYIGKSVKEKKAFPMTLAIITFLFYFVRAFIPIVKDIAFFGNLGYGLLGIAMAVITAKCLDVLQAERINRWLRSLGRISLESYLTNHFLITLFVAYLDIKQMPLFNVKPYCAIEYMMIVILGLGGAILCASLCSKIRIFTSRSNQIKSKVIKR